MCLVRFLRDRPVIELLGLSKVETIIYRKSRADFVDMQQGRVELVSGRSVQAFFFSAVDIGEQNSPYPCSLPMDLAPRPHPTASRMLIKSSHKIFL